MHLSVRIFETMVLICSAIFPLATQFLAIAGLLTLSKQAKNINGYITVPIKKIPLVMADLDSAVSGRGSMALFFPHAFSVAAPFILFRLKRSGFSNCVVKVTGKGLTLTAER